MKFRITTEVENTNGTQTWLAEASTPEEALEKYLAGEVEFEAEEIEVTSLSEPDLRDVEAVDDDDDLAFQDGCE